MPAPSAGQTGRIGRRVVEIERVADRRAGDFGSMIGIEGGAHDPQAQFAAVERMAVLAVLKQRDAGEDFAAIDALRPCPSIWA